MVITLHTTEFQGKVHACKACGKKIPPLFPEGVINTVNYGDEIRTVTTYLSNTCNVSLNKVSGFLHELTGHRLCLSEGSVHNFLAGFSKKAADILEDITDEIKASALVGSDASHTTVAGKRTYAYVFHTDDSAIYQASKRKGKAPLESSPIKDYQGILCHDHDSAYYNYGSFHVECNSHILRYLRGVSENEPERKWAVSMRELLSKANKLAKQARDEGATRLPKETCAFIEEAYDTIIAYAEREYAGDMAIDPRYRPEGIALFKRLRDFKPNHLAFIHDLSIPFTNNHSEQLLRATKRKTKQTGGFRSFDHGEVPYCDYLSITQTANMRNMKVIGVVRDVFSGKTDMFKPPGATEPPTADP